MTAINMVVQPKARAGYIISDGAHTHPNGHLIENSPKIIRGAGRFPWAAGITGNVHPRTMVQALGEANPLNLKQLMKRLSDAMRLAIKRTSETTLTPHADISIALRGVVWNFAEKRPEGFTIASHPSQVMTQPMEPYVWYEVSWNIAGAELGEPSAQLGRPVDLTDPRSFDPEMDGLALITAQRQAELTPTMPGCDPEIKHRIGGDIDLTEVTKHGVKVWKIHEFNDAIGEPIRV